MLKISDVLSGLINGEKTCVYLGSIAGGVTTESIDGQQRAMLSLAIVTIWGRKSNTEVSTAHFSCHMEWLWLQTEGSNYIACFSTVNTFCCDSPYLKSCHLLSRLQCNNSVVKYNYEEIWFSDVWNLIHTCTVLYLGYKIQANLMHTAQFFFCLQFLPSMVVEQMN